MFLPGQKPELLKPAGRRWPRRLVGILGLLLLLIAFGPTLIAMTPLRHVAAKWLLGDLPVEVRIGKASLGWFTPLVLQDVEILDAAGNPILRAPSLRGSEGLLSLLRRPERLGTFTLDQPSLEVHCSGQTTNLDAIVQHLLARPVHAGSINRSLQVQINAGQFALRDNDTGHAWTLAPLDLSLLLTGGTDNQLEIKATGPVAGAGRIEIGATVQLPLSPDGPRDVKAAASAKLETFPLAMLTPLVRQTGIEASLDGQLSGRMSVDYTGNGRSPFQVAIEGELHAGEFSLASPWLGKDCLNLNRLTIHGNADIKDNRIRIDRAEISCDAGKASLAGTMDVSGPAQALQNRPDARLDLDVDLARLVTLLPSRFSLQKDTAVQSGRLSLHVEGAPRDSGTAWKGSLTASDLHGIQQGRSLVWREPIGLDFQLVQQAREWPVVERLHCRSSFIDITGSGSADRWSATASYDLDRLAGELGRFFDLGRLRIGGKGRTTLELVRASEREFSIRVGGDASGLRISLPDGLECFEAETLLRLEGTAGLQPNGSLLIKSAEARVDAGGDRLSVRLLEPIENLGTTNWGNWQALVQGDVQRWQRRVRPAVDLSVLGPVNGRLQADAVIRKHEGRLQCAGQLTVGNFVLGEPRRPIWRENKLHASAKFAFDTPTESILVSNLELSADALAIKARAKFDRKPVPAVIELHGEMKYDLSRCNAPLSTLFGSDVQITGHGTRPFQLRGELGPETGFKSFRGSGQLGWQSLGIYGCQLGPADVHLKLADGWLEIGPVQTTLNQGRFSTSPKLWCSPGAAEFHFDKGLVIERAELSRAMCASALGHALPLLAEVAEVDGQVSIKFDGGRFPLADSGKADIWGLITIHSARVGPGPLVREFATVFGPRSTAQLRRDTKVPFRLVNGRVYHRDLELAFPDFTVRTEGSVGLDGTLALVAEMPVPHKLLGLAGNTRSTSTQTVRLPIGGTLSRPKLDARSLRSQGGQLLRNAAADALGQELDRQLQRLLKPSK